MAGLKLGAALELHVQALHLLWLLRKRSRRAKRRAAPCDENEPCVRSLPDHKIYLLAAGVRPVRRRLWYTQTRTDLLQLSYELMFKFRYPQTPRPRSRFSQVATGDLAVGKKLLPR